VGDPYRLHIARSAARALSEQLPETVAAAAYEFIVGPLVGNPHRVGKPLLPPMEPTWTARRGSYRILYLIDEETRTVTVTAIRHRSDAYRS
jgi:mRNA interferase RelE/StbE